MTYDTCKYILISNYNLPFHNLKIKVTSTQDDDFNLLAMFDDIPTSYNNHYKYKHSQEIEIIKSHQDQHILWLCINSTNSSMDIDLTYQLHITFDNHLYYNDFYDLGILKLNNENLIKNNLPNTYNGYDVAIYKFEIINSNQLYSINIYTNEQELTGVSYTINRNIPHYNENSSIYISNQDQYEPSIINGIGIYYIIIKYVDINYINYTLSIQSINLFNPYLNIYQSLYPLPYKLDKFTMNNNQELLYQIYVPFNHNNKYKTISAIIITLNDIESNYQRRGDIDLFIAAPIRSQILNQDDLEHYPYRILDNIQMRSINYQSINYYNNEEIIIPYPESRYYIIFLECYSSTTNVKLTYEIKYDDDDDDGVANKETYDSIIKDYTIHDEYIIEINLYDQSSILDYINNEMLYYFYNSSNIHPTRLIIRYEILNIIYISIEPIGLELIDQFSTNNYDYVYDHLMTFINNNNYEIYSFCTYYNSCTNEI